MVMVLDEVKSDERQREDVLGAPENDGDADVDEGHEEKRHNVEDGVRVEIQVRVRRRGRRS